MRRTALILSLSVLAAIPATSLVRAQQGESAAKPQSEVAAKSNFQTVKADADEVKKAVPAVDLAGAKKLLGKDGAFTGKVVKVYTPDSNTVIILNFAQNYREALTAALRGRDFAKFPNMQQLKDKKVLVRGKFQEYRGAMEILLTDPAQIAIITD